MFNKVNLSKSGESLENCLQTNDKHNMDLILRCHIIRSTTSQENWKDLEILELLLFEFEMLKMMSSNLLVGSIWDCKKMSCECRIMKACALKLSGKDLDERFDESRMGRKHVFAHGLQMTITSYASLEEWRETQESYYMACVSIRREGEKPVISAIMFHHKRKKVLLMKVTYRATISYKNGKDF